jgi:alanine racemase
MSLKPEIKHSACSAASIMFPETRMDMVRIGIFNMAYMEALKYLFYKHKSKIDPLQRVITWKSKIMSVKR